MANKWYCRIFGHKLCFQDGRRATKEEVLEADWFRFVDGIPTEELTCSTCNVLTMKFTNGVLPIAGCIALSAGGTPTRLVTYRVLANRALLLGSLLPTKIEKKERG
jgi:hypothetical protein